jgi:hypothetical protein
MSLFCLSEERSMSKDFFGFLWLNSIAEFESVYKEREA